MSSITPAAIKSRMRGKGYGLPARLTGGLDERQYRLLRICEKIQKKLDQANKDPNATVLTEAPIELQLHQLAQLIHEHFSEVGSTEKEFYDFVLETYGIMNAEVHFDKEPYYKYLKVIFDEHAKFKATDQGQLTSASLATFCSSFDECVDEAAKQIVPDLYHRFLGAEHPKVRLVFESQGKKEEKITIEDVKADIRSRMITSVVSLFGDKLSRSDRHDLEKALDKISLELKAHPNLATFFNDYTSIPSDVPLRRELQVVGMRLLNMRSALEKRRPYTFAQLMSMGAVNREYQHPFVADLNTFSQQHRMLIDIGDNSQQFIWTAIHKLHASKAVVESEITAMRPEVARLEKRCLELRMQLESYPDLFDEAERVTREWWKLRYLDAPETVDSVVLERKKSYSAVVRDDAYRARLHQARLSEGEARIEEFRALVKRRDELAQQIDINTTKVHAYAAQYQATAHQDLGNLQKKTYMLSDQQIRNIFICKLN